MIKVTKDAIKKCRKAMVAEDWKDEHQEVLMIEDGGEFVFMKIHMYKDSDTSGYNLYRELCFGPNDIKKNLFAANIRREATDKELQAALFLAWYVHPEENR